VTTPVPMTLLEISERYGRAVVCGALGITRARLCEVLTGREPVSASILARCLGAFGAAFNAAGTLRDHRAKDVGAVDPVNLWACPIAAVPRGRMSAEMRSQDDEWKRVMGFIIREVSVELGIGRHDITGPRRIRGILAARHAVMYIAAAEAMIPLHFIGTCIGGRDHKAVLAGMNLTAARVEVDPAFAEKINSVERRVFVAREVA